LSILSSVMLSRCQTFVDDCKHFSGIKISAAYNKTRNMSDIVDSSIAINGGVNSDQNQSMPIST
jgi:hypothetical protein